MKILNIGSCNIDLVYSVEATVSTGETISARSVSRYPGGKGLNQSIASAAAGAEVWHAGCIGPDGAFLKACMDARGVHTALVRETEDMTGHAVIQVTDTGDNCIIIWKGSNACISKHQIDEALSAFQPGDFLLLQNEISNLPYAIEAAAQKGLQIVLNPSPFDDSIRALPLEKLSWLILNEIEAAAFAGGESFPIWKKAHYPALKAVLTLGSGGSLYLEGDTVLRQSAYQVRALDTTAAGDTFTGFFIAAVAAGLPPEKALQRASAAAAIAVSRNGASVSIPDRSEVDAQLPLLRPCQSDPLSYVVQSYLEAAPANASLSGLAALAGYSVSYLSAWLKAHFHATFTELLTEERCRQAEVLLRTTDTSVSEIIARLGCTNETVFRKAFQTRTGLNPLQYRKENRDA